MMNPVDPAPPLEIYLLGLTELDDVLKLQRRLVYNLGERDGAGLILCEHPPLITVGRTGGRLHVRADDDELAALGLRMRWVGRGGGCVLHLPGQIAGYLAVPLDRMGLSLQEHLNRLDRVLIETLREFDLPGANRLDCPGVFLGNSRVASVGVAVSRWIAYHGFVLNVGPFLEPFRQLLDEPGPGGRPLRQTSMEAWRQRPTPMATVRECLIRKVEEAFGVERSLVFTQHPLIPRKVRPHVHVQSLD